MTRSYRVKVGLTERPEAMRLGATVTGQAHDAGAGRHRAAGNRADHCGQQAGRLGGRSRKPAGVAATRTSCNARTLSGIVVTRGLKDGEVVVTAGVHALRPGQKVRLLGDAQ